MGRLEGKRTIVTGAGSGLGLESAVRFAAEGARVVVVDIDEDRVRDAVAGVGERASGHVCDVTDEAAVGALVDSAVEEMGGVDCYFNNAGIAHGMTPLAELTLETWERVMAVNTTAIFLAAKAIAPVMSDQPDGGVLLVTSSISGRRPRPGLTAYTTSKGAAITLTSALAVELAPKIRVNGIAPLAAATPMFAEFGFAAEGESPEETERRVGEAVPLGRLTEPSDVASAAVFLASDEAAYITGETLNVDGGRHL
ncbi:MAG: SDR family oxidoreductase [Solirubrobacterales bacterium]|nr:SDR family oxidoreductase [Solirubrobacterales bacterium]